jgi:predicted nucleic acid-binding Zn ribbon protein
MYRTVRSPRRSSSIVANHDRGDTVSMARKRTSADDEWDDSNSRDERWSDRDRAFGEGAQDEDQDDAHEASDRARFDSDTAYCPECGAEIYDAADVCPKCFTWIDGDTRRRPPSQSRQTMRQTIIWILVAALLAGAGVLSLVELL